MAVLAYSRWHRTLGYSYFATDVDSVEVRDGQAVAIIESSECTPSYSRCNGTDGVFNRFLRETGGFQLDVAWWVGKWFGVSTFVVCGGDPDGRVHVLSLANGREASVTQQEYVKFIDDLGCKTNALEKTLTATTRPLEDVLEFLRLSYPDVARHPYFKNNTQWKKDVALRLLQIQNKVARTPPSTPPTAPSYPVKGETTGGRPESYWALRNKSKQPYLNIEWVEWRKESTQQKVGRPAALIKTVPMESAALNDEAAVGMFDRFSAGDELKWWLTCANTLLVPAYLVIYEWQPATDLIGDCFFVFDMAGVDSAKQPQKMNQQGYRSFVCSL